MKILSLNPTQCSETDTVFGVSRLGPAIAGICMCGIAVLAAYLAIYGRIGRFELPRLMAAGAGLFVLLIAWMCFRRWQAARRPTNWVLRLRNDEVLIKFRSFENWRLSDDDPQVVVLQRNEIEFVRHAVTTQVTRDVGHDTQMSKLAYLEIRLKDPDTSVLEKALATEAARPGWGGRRVITKHLDNPVQVMEKGVIRIAWNKPAAVRPGIKTALEALSQIADVAEQRKDVENFTPRALKKLGDEEQKRKLTELAGQDRIKAVEAAKQLYGCSTGKAMQVINKLTGGDESR